MFQLTFRKINVLTTRCSDHSHSSLWKSLFYTSHSKKLINPKLYPAANSSNGLTRTAVPKCTSCKKFRKQIFANQKWRSMIHKSFQQLLLKAVPRSATPREILYILCMCHLCGYWTKLFKTQKCDLRCLATVCFIISITMVVRIWCSIVVGFIARSDWLISLPQFKTERVI